MTTAPVNKADVNQQIMALLSNKNTAPLGTSLLTSRLAPKEPIKVDAGETLLDPRSFKPIYTAPPKAPTVSIDQRGETAFAKKAGEKQAEAFDKISSEAKDAQVLQADFSALKDISQRITTGKWAEFKSMIGPYAGALGVDIKGLGDLQAYEAVVAKLAPRMRVAGSGATSDFEMQNFLRSLPGLGKTPEGNEIIMSTFDALTQHKILSGQVADAVLAGQISPAEGNALIRELGDPLQAFKMATKGGPKPQAAASAPLAEAAAPPPAAMPPRSAAPPMPAGRSYGRGPQPGAQEKPPVTVTGDADYEMLPSGTRFVGPDGQIRVKP